MNDTFRLTVHWAERIVEVRWPVNPTIASWDRCEAAVRKALAELGGGWKILVDDSRGVDQSVAAREATSTWQGSRATRLFMQVRLTEIRPIDSYGERGAVANPRMAAFVQRRS